MAMQGASNPAYDVSRLGQTNLSGDVRDLFLKLYAGEVLTAFEAKNIMMPLMRTRTITKGKSASFPFLGRTSAEYHTPGNEITGGKIRASERIVTIDDLLISAQFVPNIDEAINHYDVRSTYSKEAGIALATEADKNIITQLTEALRKTGCEVRGCKESLNLVDDLIPAKEDDWSTEYLDSIISVKIVDGVEGAISHINKYSTNHTDSIITENKETAEKFMREIDSAIVMHNASTQFADGGEFGMGAEIGIATGRFHARGPVGVEQLTSFKYVVRGSGQTRP